MENSNSHFDINSCTSRGVCSLSPNIAALQELVIFFMKECAHYLLELKENGACNKKINLEIINSLSGLVSVNEYSENQLYDIVLNTYYLYKNIKDTYHKICADRNLTHKDLNSGVIFNETVSLSKAIAIGEKLFLENYKKMSLTQKNLTEILLILIKSLCVHLTKLYDFDEPNDEAFLSVLNALDFLNINESDNLIKIINELAELDSELQLKISRLIFEKFGSISKVEVSRSTSHGKAVLVSGNNFFDLRNVLEKTQDKNIDVYTHSALLVAHSLEQFKKYKNLKGHYGDDTQSCILDFATFPGAILMTKSSRTITDYLYRGRLFSTDYTVPSGVVKIENDNYEELIRATLEAKGFKRGKERHNITVGYNKDEIIRQVEKIVSCLKSGKISRLFIIGMDSYSEVQKEYYKKFFSNMRKDEYAISFFYESDNKNVLTINIGNYQPLATYIIYKFLKQYYPISSDNLIFFCTTCNVMTMSNIVMLKLKGAKNIYMNNCSPTMINPSVLDTFLNKFKVNLTTDALSDLKIIRER